MFTALIIATVLDLSLALPPSPAIDPCSAFALRRCLDMPTAKSIGGEGRIRTHGADNRTTAFEFYDSHADLSHPVPKRVVWFAIPKPMILVCDAQCHAVPCSWFAIWFANFLEVRQLGRLS